eukprot:CAMPEP_0117037404 /NCGR_PEP_ID=MMETSP0472-20121206/26407_1 /TAXON_ID=693140 ORGANISM="Tiarina fusus, Strain LIS" /NCGR_SAMPLE_ID=MMETSP0472 /ASSEMBLY_ACC=CAM_ASM_000603 /LENGTH=60 /DNA_ID=CAMNT_0004747385 /DNA_START=1880 /DNA_END=2059 /DNA_ORIENTATION=-
MPKTGLTITQVLKKTNLKKNLKKLNQSVSLSLKKYMPNKDILLKVVPNPEMMILMKNYEF